MAISQPFTRGTVPLWTEPLASQMRLNGRARSQASERLQGCTAAGDKPYRHGTSSHQLIRVVSQDKVLTYSWPAPRNKGHRNVVKAPNLRSEIQNHVPIGGKLPGSPAAHTCMVTKEGERKHRASSDEHDGDVDVPPTRRAELLIKYQLVICTGQKVSPVIRSR